MSARSVNNDVNLQFEQQRDEFWKEHRDDDACQRLWCAVIEKAISDLEWMQEIARHEELKKHEGDKLRRIAEDPPAEFLASAWFETLCSHLGVDPASLRREVCRRLDDLARTAA